MSRKLIVIVFSCLLVSACLAEAVKSGFLNANVRSGKINKDSSFYKIGKPYKIAGKTYYPKVDVNYNKTGIASWYGDAFHGKKTANGEVFNMYAISAAHPTLPLPSMVRVTNLENGKVVDMRVNDRGPFAENRVIDLSRAAAEALGSKAQGLAKVRVQYLKAETEKLLFDEGLAEQIPTSQRHKYSMFKNGVLDGTTDFAVTTPKVATEYEPASGGYKVQIASLGNHDAAKSLLSRFQYQGYVDRANVNGDNVYRAILGPFDNQAAAEYARNNVASKGFPDAFVTTK